MKGKLRKILSLIMVLAMVCGMIPAAMAAGDPPDPDSRESDAAWLTKCKEDGHFRWDEDETVCRYCGKSVYYNGEDDDCDHRYYCEPYDEDTHDILCSRSSCDFEDSAEHYFDDDDICVDCGYDAIHYDHEHEIEEVDEDVHEVICDDNRCKYYDGEEEEHVFNLNDECVYCGYEYDEDHEYDEYDEDDHKVWCYDKHCDEDHDYDDWVYEEHDFDSKDKCKLCGYSEDGDYEAKLILTQYESDYEQDKNAYAEVKAEVEDEDGKDITDEFDFDFDWEGDYDKEVDSTDTTSEVLLDTRYASCKVSCVVTATPKDEDKWPELEETAEWMFGINEDIVAEVVIFNDNEGYYLDDLDDEDGDSVVDQLEDVLYELDDVYNLEYLEFEDSKVSGEGWLEVDDDELNTRDSFYFDDSEEYNSRSDYLLSEVVFIPDEDFEGEVSFEFVAYYLDEDDDLGEVVGLITFEVKDGTTGTDIIYQAIKGDDVELDAEDFEEFWAEEYPSGELEYVKFTNVSSGNIYEGGTSSSDRLNSSDKCYLDPSSRQLDLNDLTYVPGRSTTTVTIQFSATGTTKRSGGTATESGTLYILYTAEEVEPIEYMADAEGSTLDAEDFIDLYKEVMNVTRVTEGSLSIQILELPDYGTLYAKYSDNSKTDVKLTEKNIVNYRFSGNSSASRSIDDVTYVPGVQNVPDTVTYACYYGGNLKFIGTISFGAAEPVVIEVLCSGGPVALKASDFRVSSLSGFTSIKFANPSSGTLYKSYSGTSGSKVTTGDTFLLNATTGTQSLNNVTFVPYANYSGTVEVVFFAATLRGAQVRGTLKIYVSQSFTDVSGGKHWAESYIAKLSAQGIVNGKITTAAGVQFCPEDHMKYGEALKLIMRAAGYPELAPTGSHWASGYLARAYRDGLVASATGDLEKSVDRQAIAEIACKALKIAPASYIASGKPTPVDTTNRYVYALYNAGLLTGENVGSLNYYKPADPIKRGEVCAIVCRMMDYVK